MGEITIKLLEWDEYNIAHIARHHVLQTEIEEIIRSKGVTLKSKSHAMRIVIIGKTGKERSLTVVLEQKSRLVWRTVTAYDASRKERKFYQEQQGGEKNI